MAETKTNSQYPTSYSTLLLYMYLYSTIWPLQTTPGFGKTGNCANKRLLTSNTSLMVKTGSRNMTETKAHIRIKWYPDRSSRLATTDMDRGLKWGLRCPFRRGTVFPSNTMWPAQRPTSVRSGILIHSPVWPQCTWARRGSGVPI